MAINYSQHDWATGETITEGLLDNMESGIKAACDAIDDADGIIFMTETEMTNLIAET